MGEDRIERKVSVRLKDGRVFDFEGATAADTIISTLRNAGVTTPDEIAQTLHIVNGCLGPKPNVEEKE